MLWKCFVGFFFNLKIFICLFSGMNIMILEVDSWRVYLSFTKASGKETCPSTHYDMVGRTFDGICETLEEIFSLTDLEHMSEVALHASVRSNLTEVQTLCTVQFRVPFTVSLSAAVPFHKHFTEREGYPVP